MITLGTNYTQTFTYPSSTVEVDLGSYPNGDPYIKVDPLVLNKLSGAILVQPKNLGEFMAAMFLVDSLVDRCYVDRFRLFAPFLTGSRQDRRFSDGGDLLFAAKSVASEINARNFSKVVTFDTHSDVPVGMIDRCHNIDAADLFTMDGNDPQSYDGIIIPDAGAEKRATKMAKMMRIEKIIHAWKSRDVQTGKLTGFGMEPCDPGHYLIVDDICDGGGTFLGLAGLFPDQEITADLYVTHGIFSQGLGALTETFRQVITTNSIPQMEQPGLRVIPAVERYFK